MSETQEIPTQLCYLSPLTAGSSDGQRPHQFLREGHCNQEIAKIKRRFRETRDLAEKEMEKMERGALDMYKQGYRSA